MIVQDRQKLPGVLFPVWKFQTMTADGLSNVIARIARDLSLDEMPQYAYLMLVAARPLIPAEHEWLAPPLLTPTQYADWNQIPRGGVFGPHFPQCRSLGRQSPLYLFTRYAADTLYADHLASRTFDENFLNIVVEPYLLDTAREIQASFDDATSAEERIGQWFATTAAEMLAAPSDSAPDLLRRALRAWMDRSADALSSEDRAVRQFISTVGDLLAGEHDFGRYLHSRGHPETQAFIHDVRDAVQRRAPHNVTIAVPFIDNLTGSSPRHTPTAPEADSATAARLPETTDVPDADRPVAQSMPGDPGDHAEKPAAAAAPGSDDDSNPRTAADQPVSEPQISGTMVVEEIKFFRPDISEEIVSGYVPGILAASGPNSLVLRAVEARGMSHRKLRETFGYPREIEFEAEGVAVSCYIAYNQKDGDYTRAYIYHKNPQIDHPQFDKVHNMITAAFLDRFPDTVIELYEDFDNPPHPPTERNIGPKPRTTSN
ncbi:hypothetical protein [Nocardia sp. NPDC049707]|uniref:hypothetical protein n=1 Tax=Nocardia sp. NPDC049707 TaxID=3154735 RepID=UPI0034388A29